MNSKIIDKIKCGEGGLLLTIREHQGQDRKDDTFK